MGSTSTKIFAMMTLCKAGDLPRRSMLFQLLVFCLHYYIPHVIAVQAFTNVSILGPTTTRLYFPNAATAETLTTPFPYYFPNLGQSATDLFPMPDCNGFVLEEATIDQLQDVMGKGQLTSLQIALCYLQRIQQTDEYIKYAFKPSISYQRTFHKYSTCLDTESFSVNVFILPYPLSYSTKPQLAYLSQAQLIKPKCNTPDKPGLPQHCLYPRCRTCYWPRPGTTSWHPVPH